MSKEETADRDDLEEPTVQPKDPLALVHIRSKNGGHWWQYFDVELPEYVRQTVSDEAPQRCETVPTPPVPDEVEWTEYEYYRCDGCYWACIEHQDSAAYEANQCWYCLRGGEIPDGRKNVKTLYE